MNEFKYCGIILLRIKKQTTNIKFMLVRLKSYSFWNTENYIRYNYLWIECQLDLFNSCYIYTFVRIRDVGFWNFMHIHQNFWNHKHYPKLHVRVYGLGRSRLFSLIVTVHVREISNWAKLSISPENKQKFRIHEQDFRIYEQFCTSSLMNLDFYVQKLGPISVVTQTHQIK